MTIRIQPGTKFPHTVAVGSEESIGPGHTYSTLADWCSNLMGDMDKNWTICWDDISGMTWTFRNRLDASLFNFTWCSDR
jgi:hypothetical protein